MLQDAEELLSSWFLNVKTLRLEAMISLLQANFLKRGSGILKARLSRLALLNWELCTLSTCSSACHLVCACSNLAPARGAPMPSDAGGPWASLEHWVFLPAQTASAQCLTSNTDMLPLGSFKNQGHLCMKKLCIRPSLRLSRAKATPTTCSLRTENWIQPETLLDKSNYVTHRGV